MSTKQSASTQQHADRSSELASELAPATPDRQPGEVGEAAPVVRDNRRTTVEQLALFHPEVPERFRIDEITRRRGLLHIAKIKAQLARRYPPDPPPVPRPRTPLGARARKRAA